MKEVEYRGRHVAREGEPPRLVVHDLDQGEDVPGIRHAVGELRHGLHEVPPSPITQEERRM